jgi:Ca-activated chloride channel family protein
VHDVDRAFVVGLTLTIPGKVAEIAARGEESRDARNLGDGFGVLEPLKGFDCSPLIGLLLAGVYPALFRSAANNIAPQRICSFMSSPRSSSAVGSLFLLAAVCLSAQDRMPSFRMDVPLVSLDVSVFDTANHVLTNLSQEDFNIFEDGELREIKNFSSVETPYNILALFDCTGSTREAWPFLLKSLNSFLATLRPQDRVAVLAFGAGTSTILDWTARAAEPLNVRMRMPSPLCDQTDFYGAIAAAAEKMQSVSGRRGVIVFTDGVHGGIPSRNTTVGGMTMTRFVDPSDDRAFVELRRIVETSGTSFYFIAVNTDVRPPNVDAGNLLPGTHYTPLSLFNLQQVRSRMEQIAQVSGGGIVFPQRNSETGVLFEQIVRELGTSYSMSFTPSATVDGRFHRIEVRVSGRGMRVRQSRDGYFAR